ncbi:helix-turn-helix domain-containing protein [Aneurinibacillus tyrosinisolvens]|uniref:helix-turn-helix domain-containing protein n=1 Tax=Aneurinibacillus tyrosinisolvens TaxID=1443435 RepID=UPI00063EDA02|nr:helix-turn-helix transcriptional regulator [Aneurinibacillus tyrosinisolvens]
MSQLLKIIGERLRNFRKERGLSQEELAYLASLHSTYIGQLERGEKNVTIESLEKITRALGISLEELFRYVQSTEKQRETSVLIEIISRLQGRSLEDQKTILKLLDLLTEWKDYKK